MDLSLKIFKGVVIIANNNCNSSCNTINSDSSCNLNNNTIYDTNCCNITECPSSCQNFNSNCYNPCHIYAPCCCCDNKILTPNENNLNLLEKEICYICQNHYDYFLSKPHVVGVGLGFKEIAGQLTPIDSIVVYVDKKLSENNLTSNSIVPPMYHDIPTDIVQVGSSFEPARSLKDRIRPALGGCSISPSLADYSGTFGCLVEDSDNIYILSNNHVLSHYDTFPKGTAIIQPSVPDGGITPNDIIATLERSIPILPSTLIIKRKNYVDCAIAKVTSPRLVTPRIASINTLPQGIVLPTLNVGVLKVGRTTGLTSGIVRSISTTIFSESKFLFLDQIIATLISKSGDSGSLVLDSSYYAMGLLRGVTKDNYASINPITKVLDSLNVTLVTEVNL